MKPVPTAKWVIETCRSMCEPVAGKVSCNLDVAEMLRDLALAGLACPWTAPIKERLLLSLWLTYDEHLDGAHFKMLGKQTRTALAGPKGPLSPAPAGQKVADSAEMLQNTRLNAEYWLKAGWQEHDRDSALTCLEQGMNTWKNAAYALAAELSTALGGRMSGEPKAGP
jgi:hypothetical protein